MALGFLVLITALTISGVAIYYSVAGLVAIFAAAAIPIIIMGTALELAKLITAIWLHKYWDRTTWWLKAYLSVATIILMLITSMGIFGFLSNAHIQQSTASGESVAQVERINTEVARQESIIARADLKIKQVETTGTGADANLQQQIDKEQTRVDTAYTRIAAAEKSLSLTLAPLQLELDTINDLLTALQSAISNNNIVTAQSIVGVTPDGKFGSRTEDSIELFRTTQVAQRDKIATQIQSIRNSNESINIAQQQVKDSNELITRLRAQLGQGTAADVDSIVNAQSARITEAYALLDKLADEKYQLEADYRQLEAEVGPIKYIAEFIYGSTDKDLLEESVRWMIVIIIFVFDPLAVLLLIASQYTFTYYREDHPKDDVFDTIGSAYDKVDSPINFSLLDTFETTNKSKEDKIPDIQIETEDEQIRADLYARLDTDLTIKSLKQAWKELHPNDTIKEYKNAYIKGHIQKLPWEPNAEQDNNSNITR